MKRSFDERQDGKEEKETTLFVKGIIHRRISLPITLATGPRDLQDVLLETISRLVEGRCAKEGFIRPKSCHILTFSAGTLHADEVDYEVVFDCMICCPAVHAIIDCAVVEMTKPGIRAETIDKPSPIVVFIASEPFMLKKEFQDKMHKDATVRIRVVGQRYELNDMYISILGEIID